MKIFDAHFHIIDPDFPLVKNNGYLPPAFTADDYQRRVEKFDVIGGAIVSGSFQTSDQAYLTNALDKLGPNFVGVANIPGNISDKKLAHLSKAGVVAVRLNIVRGDSNPLDTMIKRSNQLYEDFGWHSELYVKNNSLKNMWEILKQLPTFSIDHLGLTKNGIDRLLQLVDRGVKVKATGFGRLDFNPVRLMKKIYAVNSEALLFGTDLPSTRAEIPFSAKDVKLIKAHFSKEEQKQIFYRNAAKWYQKKTETEMR